MKTTKLPPRMTLSLLLILMFMLFINIGSTQAVSPASTKNDSYSQKVYNPENDHWYQSIETRMSWHAAKNYCADSGGYLVTIQSEAENTFVYELLPSTWLGATDEIEEGVWEWVTGESMTYTNWKENEPNNGEWEGHNGPYEHYLNFEPESDGQWNDVVDEESNFVCEFTKGTPADLAREVVGKPYLSVGGNLTIKGWNEGRFVEPDEIEHLDCSGLIYWAYNKSDGATSFSNTDNPIYYQNADGIYRYNSKSKSESDLSPGDVIFFNWKTDGEMDEKIDHVVMYVGNGQIVSAQSGGSSFEPGYIGLFDYDEYIERYRNFIPDDGFREIKFPKVGTETEAHSPINLSVTDPDGNVITHDSWITTDEEAYREVANTLYYIEWDENGHDYAKVFSPSETPGTWLIDVQPKPEASGTDTYTLIVTNNDEVTILAENVQVDDIPPEGYSFQINGIQSFLPIIKK